MHDLFQRLALALLLACGLATLVGLPALSAAEPLDVRHRQVLLLLLGAGLAAAPWVRALRLPAIGAGVLAKLALVGLAAAAGSPLPWPEVLQVAALALAGGVLVRQARLEDRWNGVLPLRQEGW